MPSDLIFRRVAFVIALLVIGGLVIVIYGGMALTPLAVWLLPTETEAAKFVSDHVLVEYRPRSPEQRFHSEVSYADRTATLITTTPLSPLAEPEREAARMRMDHAMLSAGIFPPRADVPEPANVTVRYLRAFPAVVARDIPGGNLAAYYRDSWTKQDASRFLGSAAFVAVLGVGFCRHLRKHRRAY
jgi:hypothetical protein